jgi:hypothetical protein
VETSWIQAAQQYEKFQQQSAVTPAPPMIKKY